MYRYSKSSKRKLETCDVDLQILFNEIIKHRDCTVVSGMRTPQEQLELYKKGRLGNKGPIVTNVDGYNKKSKHNHNPSLAADVVPYPIDWNDIDRFKEFGNFVQGVAVGLGLKIEWGGNWRNFKDYPHYQIKK